MPDPKQLTRRGFLRSTFAFSAAAALSGCGAGVFDERYADPVTGGISHFLMVGDWGIESGSAQSVVANAMRAYPGARGFETDALLMLGDNFYGDMPDAANSPRWQTNFEQMYPHSVFDCEAIAVPGNHDYQRTPDSKLDGQYAYAARGGTRWTMPSRFFRFTWPQKDPSITFICLDSNMPNERAQPWPPPDATYYTQTDAQRQEQLDWLTNTLSQPLTTPFLAVIGHHPLYSNGPHGDNATLIRDWDPLFRKAGVHLYLAGHDHDLQHLEFEGHPTSFFSSGGGGADLNTLRPSLAHRGPFQLEAHGFSHLQVRSDLMILRHLDTNGHLLHKFTKTPDGVVTILK